MESYAVTDMGKTRSMNEDYFYTSIESVGHLPNLFIVADGMGGHSGGEFASRHAVDAIVKEAKKSRRKDPEAILSLAITAANKALLEHVRIYPKMKGMGTTVVAATYNKGELTVANVGDSRLYLVGDTIRQITVDHSLVQEMIRIGELTEEEAKHHPNKNVITRAIGPEKEVKIDFFHVCPLPKDKILLCSDGLTNMVDNEQIRQILNDEQLSLEKKVELLADTANKNGGKDNITLVVVDPEIDEV